MTLQQEKQLREIVEQLRNDSHTKFRVDHFQLLNAWNNAVIYNRKQNDLIKRGDSRDIVKTFTIKCEEAGELINVSIRAEKDYSRFQWFKLLVAIDSLFYTRQLVAKYFDFVAKPARALSLILLLSIGVTLASCGHQEPKGYPVVNDLTSKPTELWLLTGTSVSATARSLADGRWGIDSAKATGGHTHFYYRKGDSTRHVITYAGHVVSDKRALN